MKRSRRSSLFAVLFVPTALAIFAFGCNQPTAEDPNKPVADAADKAQEELEDAKGKFGDAAESAKDALGDAAKSAKGALGDAAKSAKGALGDAAKSAKGALGDAAAGAGDVAKKLSDSLGEGFTQAADKAAAALEDVKGGGETLTKLKGLFASVQTTLQGVTDKASAEVAAAKLGDLSGSAAGLAAKFDALPGDAKTALQGVIAQAMGPLKQSVDRVMEIPGVQDVLKPKLEALMAKLRSLAGNGASS